ncbi:MAG: T9SS type A sorting domain-containing protein [Bacteroidales bacterium]|nr:T9SS type A sorting domain-containing protein [Bacteroidales bacterium]
MGQTIRLFTQDGKALISTQSADINLAGLPAGVYILQSGSQAARIIKK